MRKSMIGVMGSGESASASDIAMAFELGRMIAEEGWVLLSGGRNVGVMEAVNKGAKSEGGVTVGIVPGRDTVGLSDFVDIPIVTGMGSARNVINVLSSDLIIACGEGGAGTASEIAHALKAKKDAILVGVGSEAETFFKKVGEARVHVAESPEQAIQIAKQILSI